jgi:monofunctional biosynthetic peptidoglycan transglycosylase
VIRTLVRCIVSGAVAGAVLLGAAVALYRVVPPPVTPLMLIQAPRAGITRTWVPLDAVAPVMVRSVIAAEDARFFLHHGVDWGAIEDARDYNDRHGGKPRRGGSTITMQCARNVFLWQGKSYFRKALEAALAYAIDTAWGKRRVLEVYLNVIEWGTGVYGVEAAAQANFGVAAAELDARQAALLAAVLPNPLASVPARPTRSLLARAALIERRAASVRLDPLGAAR